MGLLGPSVEENIIRQVAGARPLSEISVDKLWTRLEAEPLTDLDSLVRAETLRRIIQLRTSDDGWHEGCLGDLLLAEDLTDDTGANPGAVDAQGRAEFTGDGVSTDFLITIPSNYVVILMEGVVFYTGNQTVTIHVFSKVASAAGNYWPALISEALNNTGRAIQSEYGDDKLPIIMTPGCLLNCTAGAAWTNTKVLTVDLQIRWKRLPTLVGRE